MFIRKVGVNPNYMLNANTILIYYNIHIIILYLFYQQVTVTLTLKI